MSSIRQQANCFRTLRDHSKLRDKVETTGVRVMHRKRFSHQDAIRNEAA